MKNFVPLRDNLLVKFVKEEAKTGKLIRVENDTDKLKEAFVISAGEGRFSFNGTLIPTKARPGDKVLMNKLSGYPVEDKDTGENYMIISEEFVSGILK